jgi:hypothetical protein
MAPEDSTRRPCVRGTACASAAATSAAAMARQARGMQSNVNYEKYF